MKRKPSPRDEAALSAAAEIAARWGMELEALANMPDSEIDTSDIPEQRDWTGAERGKFSRKGKP